MGSRVIAYVDGFNLYFGLKSSRLWSGYWLDIPKLLTRFLTPDQTLELVKYFTARVTDPPDKARRQNEYIEALEGQPRLATYFGTFQVNRRVCFTCSAVWPVYNEKKTDVNIAVQMMSDAARDHFDTAFLLSADSDLIAPIEAIRDTYPSKRIVVIFPPCRASVDLAAVAHEKRKIKAAAIIDCQFPEFVNGLDGFPRRRPFSWTAYPITSDGPSEPGNSLPPIGSS